MVALWLAVAALAAPVVCDRDAAVALVEEARLDPDRVPLTHPWLMPGLAMRSEDPALLAALRPLCAEDVPRDELSVARVAVWETAAWTALTLRIGRTHEQGCLVAQDALDVTIGVGGGGYRLVEVLPRATVPLAGCEEPARYREETVIAGRGERVQLALVVDRVGAAVEGSRLVLKEATAAGWRAQVLADPAPERLLGGLDGPVPELVRTGDVTWVVLTGDRVVTDGVCAPVPGQRLWTPTSEGWVAHEGARARTLLAERGLWRVAGEDGWLLLLAQDDEDDRELLEARKRRLSVRQPDIELLTLASSAFPELNAGYLVVTPPPFATRAEAEAVRHLWGRRATTYVKRAWPAVDGCAGLR